MAVKVVSKRPDRSVVKRVVCGNCGSMLEYTPNDITEDKRTDYTGSSDIYEVIVCPKCKDKIEV